MFNIERRIRFANQTFYMKITAFLVLVIIMSACKSGTKPFHTYFWTSSPPQTKLFLFIDDQNKGTLPYLQKGPTCDNETLKKQTLYVLLESGAYEVSVRDEAGNIKFTETLEVDLTGGDKTISVATRPQQAGKSFRTDKGDCLIEEIVVE